MSENILPPGWENATLGDLTEVNPRLNVASLPSDTEVSFVPMSAVEVESGRMNATETRRLDEVRRGSYTPFQEGDVLFAKITPSMENGKSAVAQTLTSGIGFGSTEFHVFRPAASVEPKFVRYYVVQEAFRRTARGHMKGTAGQLRVPANYLQSVPLPIPPVAEQRRIVAAIEKQFALLDAGVAALERTRANLKRYRASVLKAAVEGRLTERWREEHPDTENAETLLERILEERRARWEEDQLARYAGKKQNPPKNWRAKYKEPAAPNTADLPELPQDWWWASLPQIGWFDRGRSRHRPRNAPHLYDGPYPFIQTSDIRRANTVIKEYKQTYSEAGLEQSKLWPVGTLCITIAANIAETAILGFDSCFPDSVVGLSVSERFVSIRFVELYLRTIRRRLEEYAPATAQKNINIETLKNIAVALPPYTEQEEIVAEVERRLSVAEGVEAQVEAGLKRAARLRQAILKRAFEGRLVPQDPDDEPAEALLERIRAERAAANGKLKRKGRARTSRPSRAGGGGQAGLF